jgi:uncharacterized protein (TIGR04255 family)
MKLPLKLKVEPLVEAVFEVRFTATAPTSSIFPGLLFSSLPGEKSFQRQPTADLPEVVRNSDVNWQYAPTVGLVWQGYVFLIGDRSYGVACRLPYPGWTRFKSQILDIHRILSGTAVFTEIERCSLKYTNIIPKALGSTPDLIAVNVSIGSRSVESGPLQLRSEIFEGELIHINRF